MWQATPSITKLLDQTRRLAGQSLTPGPQSLFPANRSPLTAHYIFKGE